MANDSTHNDSMNHGSQAPGGRRLKAGSTKQGRTPASQPANGSWQRMTRRVRPWLLTLFILLTVAVAVRLSLKSDRLLNLVKQKLITQAESRINGQLTVERIKGDLLKGVVISGIRITSPDGEPLLTLDSLEVAYSLSGLLQSPHRLDHVGLFGLDATLRQAPGEPWNAESIMTASEGGLPAALESGPQDPGESGREPGATDVAPYEEDPQPPFTWIIENLVLLEGRLDAESEQIPEGRLILDRITARLTNLGFDGAYFGELNDLRFHVEESTLGQPLDVSLAGSADEGRVTLGRLAINTGRSLVQSRAELEQLERLEGELTLSPLSREDLTALSGFPAEQDMEVTIGFRGTLPTLYLNLEASATGLSRLNLETTLNLEDPYSLEYATVEIENFNGPLFAGRPTWPVIQTFSFEAGGALAWSDPFNTQNNGFSGSFSTGELLYDSYAVSRTDGYFDWNGSTADLSVTVAKNDEEVTLGGSVNALQSETPGWHLTAEGAGIDLAKWLNDPALESELTIALNASGTGFNLTGTPIDIETTLTESRFSAMRPGNLTLSGRLSAETFNGEFQGGIDENRLSGILSLTNWQETPSYSFTAETEGLNLAAFEPLNRFPTWLKIEIEGQGTGFTTEDLTLTSTVRVDSSIVNDEMIEEFTASLDIRDQYITLSDATLQSTIADGTFSLRHHLSDFRDPENRLEMDLTVETVASLAPLFGNKPFEAHGRLNGTMSQAAGVSDTARQFSGTIDFEQLSYDTLYRAERVSGTLDILMEADPRLVADLEISQPVYNDIAINSIRIATETVIRDSPANASRFEGSLRLDLVQDSENNIMQEGSFSYDGGQFRLRTTGLNITTPYRSLSLSDPFNLTWQDSVLQMDMLSLTSNDGSAHLQLAIPYLGPDRQEVRLDTEQLNLGTIQQSLLDNIYAEAILSGSLNVVRIGSDIEAESDLLLTGIELNGSTMDSVKTAIRISDGRLNLTGSAWNDSVEFFTITSQLPFQPINPMSLDDNFFRQPVSGSFDLNGVSGEYLSSFITSSGNSEIDGEIRFHGEIGGTAGEPFFSGNLKLAESTISNVRVDSVSVDIHYSHEDATVGFVGFVRSLNTEVAVFDAELPLNIDLRRFKVDLPAETDEFTINLTTDAFNLSLLNSFLNSELATGLEGTLDGRLEVTGRIGDPDPQGELTLRNGRIRIVPADIVISETNADLRFDSDRVTLETLSMRSGRGRLRAEGVVDLEQLRPGAMDIRLNASQFRIANRPDLNAVVDLNGTLGGAFLQPEITGSMQFRSGFVYLQNFGENSIEEITLEDEPEGYSVALYDSIAVDMDVSFNRQFYIRNRQYLDMEVELEGTVDLAKEKRGDLQMFGTLEGVEGYARPLGREFRVENAQVTFFGPLSNPELNIRTLYRPPQADENISIWYIIEGTVDEPEFSFESQPYLELQDIISYTIFGQPFYALDSWAQVVSANGSNTSATDIPLELLLDRVGTLATRRLGIDVVQIDNSRTGSGSTTSIKTGWYLNNRTFFAISNEISTTPQTLFILEYMLRKNLELVITQGDNSREGIDLRWSFDY